MGQRLDNAKALYLGAIGDGNAVAAIEAYSGDRYTQHSTPVRDGQQGFIEFFAEFVERNPDRDIEIIRSFEDGRYVFLHVVQILNAGEFRYVTADIFDTDDDAKMIEHWDMIEELVDRPGSDRTQIDGPTVVIDLDKTEENKELVDRFMREALLAGDLDRLDEFVSPALRQHAPTIGDGIDGLREHLTDGGGRDAGAARYVEVHRIVGSGNFVAVMSEIAVAGVATATIDLFRVKDGMIAEHWDVSETITPEETWVNSGKF